MTSARVNGLLAALWVSACGGDGSPATSDAAVGTCGVLHSTTLALPASQTNWPLVQRMANGFLTSGSTLCPEVSATTQLVFTPDDATLAQTSLDVVQASFAPPACTLALHGPSSFAALSIASAADAQVALSAALVTADTTAPSMPFAQLDLGSNVVVSAASSFDGLRAGYVVQDAQGGSPQLFLFDATGARVGTLSDTATSTQCLQVTPTAHGVAVSTYRTSGTPTFHLQELAADGSLVQDVSLPARPATSSCPRIVPTSTGITAAFHDDTGDLQVVQLVAGTVHTFPSIAAVVRGEPEWITATRAGGVLWIDRVSTSAPRLVYLSAGGKETLLIDDVGAYQVAVAGEDGRLFLTRPQSASVLVIDELGCTGDALAH